MSTCTNSRELALAGLAATIDAVGSDERVGYRRELGLACLVGLEEGWLDSFIVTREEDGELDLTWLPTASGERAVQTYRRRRANRERGLID